MDRRSWSLLLALAAIWGASYLLIKIGIRDLSPVVVAWLRITLAALVLVPVAAARGALASLRGRVATVAVVGAVQVGGPFLLIAAGELEISSALAGILVASTPLFTALLALWIDHEERSHGMRLLGVLVGLGGVGMLLGIDLGGSGGQLLGGLAVLLAGLGYSVGGFVVKKRLGPVEPIGLAAGVMLASAVLLAPAAAVGVPSELPGAGPLAAVLTLGVVGTGVAFALFYELMGRVGPARAFVVTYLAPGFAVLYGALLLGEEVTPITLAGLASILAGSWLAAEGRLSRRPPPGAAPEAGVGIRRPGPARRASWRPRRSRRDL